MAKEFDRVLAEANEIIKSAIKSLNRSNDPNGDSNALVLSLTHPQNSEILKCTVTLHGSDIVGGDVTYKAGGKVTPAMNNVFKTSIITSQMKYWFLQQMHECKHHLERAIRYIQLADFDRNFEQMNKAAYAIFAPPIPENMAFSFYIQGSKLSFAVYHCGQGKTSGYFKHVVEANVPSIANLLAQLTHILSLLQHLRDKFQIFEEYQNGSDWKAMIEQEQEQQEQQQQQIEIDDANSIML
ncbi:unnamed protein product [Didymodactylos carnosus]|uniref:Uncharacterized protein n=1 Tax=Didymodactylos carnosus TaxID=1234261 RepID=A0A815IPU3_9BILA|nr:unnamed protein product [Didymodactylos carnosus]CAF1369236.1 unnamed protein product [Didymodactylos carnosus]CAF3578621.1 unnamed protein product [Didymodactylos carnosus]CAF4254006.1 unnamed protein product [Didymodactylos carnosus]